MAAEQKHAQWQVKDFVKWNWSGQTIHLSMILYDVNDDDQIEHREIQ